MACCLCDREHARTPAVGLSCGHTFCGQCIAKPLASQNSSCPICHRRLTGVAEQAASALHDAVTAAVARGVPATKLAWVEKKLWKMFVDVSELEPPQDKRAATMLPLLNASSAPSLKSKKARQGAGTNPPTIQLAEPVAEDATVLTTDLSARGTASTLPDEKRGRLPAVDAASLAAAKWHKRHRRIHSDDPIRASDLEVKPSQPIGKPVGRLKRAMSSVSLHAQDQAQADTKAQAARKVAHAIGCLRNNAQSTGGEIDRKVFYAALVEHGMLASEANAAYTDAPVSESREHDQPINQSIDLDLGECRLGHMSTAQLSPRIHARICTVGPNLRRYRYGPFGSALCGGARERYEGDA